MAERRTTFITGSGIGIGRATALAFAKSGDHVVVTDVLEKEGNAVVAEIKAAGGSAEFHRFDVRDGAAADRIIAAIGTVDVLIANAGIAHKVPLEALTDEKWDHTFDIDLKGMWHAIRPALGAMKAK
jgi:3-oxoacyl-[acyl-carrier protein] reductase